MKSHNIRRSAICPSLEKQLDFPAVLVNGRNRGGSKGKQVSQQHDLSFVHRIPDHDAPQQARAILFGFLAGEANQLVGANAAALWNGTLLGHFVRRILLQAGDKVDFRSGPLTEQRVVVIAAIHSRDGAGVERKGFGHLHIAALGFGDQHVTRQVVVVVQQNVSLDAAFGSAKLGPRKQVQTKRNGG